MDTGPVQQARSVKQKLPPKAFSALTTFTVQLALEQSEGKLPRWLRDQLKYPKRSWLRLNDISCGHLNHA